jgi:pilus assembly protein CpaF
MSRLQRGITGITNATNASGFNRSGSMSQNGVSRDGTKSFEDLKRLIHGKLVDKLDLS